MFYISSCSEWARNGPGIVPRLYLLLPLQTDFEFAFKCTYKHSHEWRYRASFLILEMGDAAPEQEPQDPNALPQGPQGQNVDALFTGNCE